MLMGNSKLQQGDYEKAPQLPQPLRLQAHLQTLQLQVPTKRVASNHIGD
jgi:hypothetical protein